MRTIAFRWKNGRAELVIVRFCGTAMGVLWAVFCTGSEYRIYCGNDGS